MATESLQYSGAHSSDLDAGLSRRLFRYFRAEVEDWCDVCRHLTDWEDAHLTERPTPERLAEHERLLTELEKVGRWLARSTESPDFPDRSTADLITMTLQDLKDRRALWHGNTSPGRREQILRAVFHES